MLEYLQNSLVQVVWFFSKISSSPTSAWDYSSYPQKKDLLKFLCSKYQCINFVFLLFLLPSFLPFMLSLFIGATHTCKSFSFFRDLGGGLIALGVKSQEDARVVSHLTSQNWCTFLFLQLLALISFHTACKHFNLQFSLSQMWEPWNTSRLVAIFLDSCWFLNHVNNVTARNLILVSSCKF